MGISKTMANGKVVSTGEQEHLQEEMGLRQVQWEERGNKLCEKWEKTDGMDLGNGKMADIYSDNKFKAINTAYILENTEKKLKEYQTSSYLGITPQEIVKVFRFAYPNSVITDLFNVWAMESVKDTFYKIETKYGSTKRGSTAEQVIYENYNDGRYPTSYEIDTDDGDNSTTNFTGTLAVKPIVAYNFRVYVDSVLLGQDDGNGNVVGSGVTSSTINYTTGAYDVTFTTAPATGTGNIEYQSAFDAEQESLFDEVGTVLLGLVAYDFRATFHSMKAEWHRFTEEVSQSKLKRSARQDLLDGIADVVRKSLDEFSIKQGIRASQWTPFIDFDTNFANNGSDSDFANAQSLYAILRDSEAKAYADLGRYPERVSILAGHKAISYLSKVQGWEWEANPQRIGIYCVGKLREYKVFEAPPAVVDPSQIYLFGKGQDALSTDAVVSFGMYRGGVTSDELEFASFKNSVGLGMMMDWKVNNKKMSSRVRLLNL